MNLTVRIPRGDGANLDGELVVEWSQEAAKTAVGKPLLDRPRDGLQIGVVRDAWVEAGDLVLTVEVNGASVEYDLKDESVRCVSLVPALAVRA